MVGETVSAHSDAVQVAALLDSPEIDQLVTELEATRWTGRPGYPIRAAIGCPDPGSVPSVHACYRFTAKLRAFKPLLDA